MNQPKIESCSSIGTELRASFAALTNRLELNPSLTLEWCELSSRTVGTSVTSVAYFNDSGRDNAISGFMPYFFSRARMAGIPMTILQPASNLVSYHAELVTIGDRLEFLSAFLTSVPRWDVFHFANVDVSGETSRAIQSVAHKLNAPLQIVPGDASPYISINGTWDAFLKTRNKKFRYKIRHRREMLGSDAKLRLVWYDCDADVKALLNDVLRVEAQSWKARAGLDIASDDRERAYHESLLPFLAANRMLFACVLYSSQQPIAYSLCCYQRDTGWVGQLKTSFDENFKHLSPGAIVIDSSIEKAFEISAREFDFLGDQGEHKLYWTSSARAHADYFLFAPRLKSRIVGWLKEFKARVATKSNRTSNDDSIGE
jgi:CelD/BcsL family acetyltransferase involved in cellulose biosynthesis